MAGIGDDARLWGFRHGFKGGNNAVTTCYGNLTFFDGHTELVSDGAATNPDYWFPTGTKLGDASAFWNYAHQHWPDKSLNISISNPYIVP
jgi:prepilin-type processing-associated H-X9-DG protein